MRALIFAAGYGTRLGKLTKSLPKPMIDICGKPCIEHIIDDLNKQGVYEIIVNTHYLPEKIMNYLGNRVLYFHEPELLGEDKTLRTVIANFPTWGREYLVVKNGDTLTNVKLAEMMNVSKGDNIAYFDYKSEVYAGTKILSPEYFIGNKNRVYKYFDRNSFWVDIGTPKELARARQLYSVQQDSIYN